MAYPSSLGALQIPLPNNIAPPFGVFFWILKKFPDNVPTDVYHLGGLCFRADRTWDKRLFPTTPGPRHRRVRGGAGPGCGALPGAPRPHQRRAADHAGLAALTKPPGLGLGVLSPGFREGPYVQRRPPRE